MKVYWDISNSINYSHHSGVHRVSLALGKGLQSILDNNFQWVSWNRKLRAFQITNLEGKRQNEEKIGVESADSWLISAEIFRERERKGFSQWRQNFPGKTAFIFHDLIPILHPEFTWPKSVRRHPHYIQLLAGADRIFSVSDSSLKDLIRYTEENKIRLPQIDVLKLGSFWMVKPDRTQTPPPPFHLLQVGILEPRKNQDLLLDALEELWAIGAHVQATFVGRVNPYFGKSIARRIRRLQKAGNPLKHLNTPDDATLVHYYGCAHLTVMPSRVEGAGLPLLESSAMETPVLCSDIPSLQEYGQSLGARFFRSESRESLAENLRQVIEDPQEWDSWQQQVKAKIVPSLKDTARKLLELLQSSDAG